jgi:hypothetical protein
MYIDKAAKAIPKKKKKKKIKINKKKRIKQD